MITSTLLSGYGFDEALGPYLVLDELTRGATVRRRFHVRNAPLTLTSTEARFCTGTFDLDTYESQPCPEQAAVNGELETCFRCFKRTGFNPSFYNVPRDTLSPAQLAYNQRPHVVYLAYFAEGSVKIGISSHDRVFVRWRGQGARLALRLCSVDDAYAAREVEERGVRLAGLPETMRAARKRELLNLPLNPEAAKRTLEFMRAHVAARCDLTPAHSLIHDLTHEYLGEHALDLPITDVSGEARPTISGVGLGMIGDILLVVESGRQYMLSVKDLIGRVVTLEPAVRRNQRRPTAGQLGFGF